MKPYGLRDKFKYNYVDCHPKKGFINWWENEAMAIGSKKIARRQAKKLINNMIDIPSEFNDIVNEEFWNLI